MKVSTNLDCLLKLAKCIDRIVERIDHDIWLIGESRQNTGVD